MEMKKIFLFTILLFQLTIVFGQGTRSEWSPYVTISCYQGLQGACKYNGYRESINEYEWNVRLKNNYSKTAHVTFYYSIGGQKIDVGIVSIAPGAVYRHTPLYVKNNSSSWTITVEGVCFAKNWFGCTGPSAEMCSAICDNGTPNIPTDCGTRKSNQSPNNNEGIDNRNSKEQIQQGQQQQGQQRIQQEQEQQMQLQLQQEQQRQLQLQQEQQRQQQLQQEQQRQQQLQQEQQRQQQLQQGIEKVTTATVNLVSYYANRNNVFKNLLSKEDGQALIDIVNSDNPTNYTQKIIQIFKDLGYSYRETGRQGNDVIIKLNNGGADINDLLEIYVRPAASYDYYNSIYFSYGRPNKLLEQLAVLGDRLNGLNLQGISASNSQKKLVEDKEKLDVKTKSVKLALATFEKLNYWDSITTNTIYFVAKSIAEAYEDKNCLNNKFEAIRFYRKAASINIDDLALIWKRHKHKKRYAQEELGKVYFKLAYLIDTDNDNKGKEAIMWYLKSSEVGYSEASSNFNIGRFYEFGFQGIEKDWNQAKKYYEIAADKKYKKAMLRLGLMYKTGGPNLEQDVSKSKKWFKKAGE